MKPKARYTTRYGQSAPQLLPPDLQSLGSIAFTAHDFKRLDAWLAEDGWPVELQKKRYKSKNTKK